jgi:hypothetical protein
MRQPLFSCGFGLVRGFFGVGADFFGALDEPGEKVDPVLREVIGTEPLRVAVDSIGVFQGTRLMVSLPWKGAVG